MHRHRNSVWTNHFLSLVMGVLLGILFSLIMAVFFSAAAFFLLKDTVFVPYFSGVSLIMGTFAGSHICGKYRRKMGLADGFICAVIMYAVLWGVSLLIPDGSVGLDKFLMLSISGIIGGISGVNSKRPKNYRD